MVNARGEIIMDKMLKDEEYISIVSSILATAEFSEEMSQIKHHDSTRLNHLLKVSYCSYKIAKYLRLDYDQVARAGLLHDFYLESVYDHDSIKERVLLYTIKHPQKAVENAKKYFQLTEKEEDIIRTHMFPVDIKVPKYAESWVVSFVDKGVSTIEFGHKFGCQVMNYANIIFILLLNFVR